MSCRFTTLTAMSTTYARIAAAILLVAVAAVIGRRIYKGRRRYTNTCEPMFWAKKPNGWVTVHGTYRLEAGVL